MPPLRFAKSHQHRCAPLQAAPLVQRRQVLILRPQGRPTCESNKTTLVCYPHITCFAGQCFAFIYSWTLLRPRSIPDASRCLRTRTTVQHGVTTMMPAISIWARRAPDFYHWTIEQTQRNSRNVRRQMQRTTRHKRASAPRGRPTLRGTMSSPERNLCNSCFVVDSGL